MVFLVLEESNSYHSTRCLSIFLKVYTQAPSQSEDLSWEIFSSFVSPAGFSLFIPSDKKILPLGESGIFTIIVNCIVFTSPSEWPKAATQVLRSCAFLLLRLKLPSPSQCLVGLPCSYSAWVLHSFP